MKAGGRGPQPLYFVWIAVSQLDSVVGKITPQPQYVHVLVPGTCEYMLD